MSEINIKPFLKWPGGKRWLTPKIQASIPIYNTYIEPFLGSGAMFFALLPNRAILSDINRELIEVYRVMKDNPLELKKKMQYHQRRHGVEYYYAMRKKKFRTPLNRASKLLYLNRVCFNGMYRVNRKGEFNVPIGTKDNCLYDVDMFEKYSNVLKNAQIEACDFQDTIKKANPGDLIFADPPYATHIDGCFVKYNEKLFTWSDQRRLLNALLDAKNKGAAVISTNACCNEIKEMYENSGFFVYETERSSNISGNKAGRKRIKELLISSFEFDRNEEPINDKNSDY